MGYTSVAHCPLCGSENVRYREKRDNWICDDCDHIFTIPGPNVASKEDKKIRIFISYGHDTTPIVERICRDLMALHFDVWVDTAKIKSGDDWRHDITEGILNSQVVLAMLSTYGLRSGGVCLDELAIAVGCNRNIIRSCLMDSEAASLIPSTINGTEYIDMTDWRILSPSAFEIWYAEKFQEILRNIRSAQDFRQDSILKELELRIRPILFSHQYAELSKRVTARPWLSARVEDWVEKDIRRTLLLTAYPGSGKTTFCTHYFHFNPLMACLALCYQSIDGVDETSQIIRNIAYQMAQSSITYRKNLLWTLNNTQCDLAATDVRTLFNLLICTPFRLEIDGNHAPMIIVIDGMDALDQDEKNQLAELISINIDKLPSFVHILVSSRHSEAIINNLSNACRIDINPTAQETTDDLICYLREAIPSIDSQRLNSIAKSCHGSFLYASLLSSAINNGIISLDETQVLLPQMEILYYHAMNKLFARRDLYDRYWRALACLIASNGKIPMEILRVYMRWSPYEMNAFCARMMMFLQRWIDRRGCQWIGVVYPSFVTWLTSENNTHLFHISQSVADTELANALWKRYEAGEVLSDYELEHAEEILRKAHQIERINALYHDTRLLYHLLDRIKGNQDDPRQYGTFCRLMDFCRAACNAVKSEEAYRIAHAELPLIEIQQHFIASSYHTMFRCYTQEQQNIDQYCNPTQRLHILYMIATVYDYIGERRKAVDLFKRLATLAEEESAPRYAFYALIGLLWDDHFNNIEEGKRLINRLNTFTPSMLGEENELLRQLMVARFKASSGELNEAFNLFQRVVREDSTFIWGYNSIAVRIQMLLIEALVAAYDTEQYLLGVEIGEHIYAHIKDTLSLSTCYCASWLVMNYIQCGNMAKVEQLMNEATYRYEQLSKIGESAWLNMHLKSVRSQIAMAQHDANMAVQLLWSVIDLARQTNDAWVLGDAYFDLFAISRMQANTGIAMDESRLLSDMQQIAELSGLPHLRYKALLMKNMISPKEEDAIVLWEETNSILSDKNMPSTNYFMVAYLCYEIYTRFYPKSDELEHYIQLVHHLAETIERQNPGIHFIERNEYIILLNKSHHEREL